MWITRSGARSEEQVREFQDDILSREWDLPYDTPLEMIIRANPACLPSP